MLCLKSNLSKILVVYFFINSSFCINLVYGVKQTTVDMQFGEVLPIKNKFTISNEITREAYELFSPDWSVSVTVCKKKDQPESPDKERPFFLTKTKDGLIPNFDYCFPIEGKLCPKGLFYFSVGPTDALMDLVMSFKKYAPLRSSPESEELFTFTNTKQGQFKRVGINGQNISFGAAYNESTATNLHPFNFLTDKGEINLNELLQPKKDISEKPKSITEVDVKQNTEENRLKEEAAAKQKADDEAKKKAEESKKLAAEKAVKEAAKKKEAEEAAKKKAALEEAKNKSEETKLKTELGALKNSIVMLRKKLSLLSSKLSALKAKLGAIK
jgi:hypothetical protein